jgi:hypothetical protein
VPGHVARLVSPLVVDYFASTARPGASASLRGSSRMLIFDYFTYAANSL